MVSKRASIEAYKERIGDEWTSLFEDLFFTCKLAWAHHVPTGAPERLRLREMCRHLNELENFMLRLIREFLLTQLVSSDATAKLGALRTLTSIDYGDDAALHRAIHAAAADRDIAISEAAQQVIARWNMQS